MSQHMSIKTLVEELLSEIYNHYHEIDSKYYNKSEKNKEKIQTFDMKKRNNLIVVDEGETSSVTKEILNKKSLNELLQQKKALQSKLQIVGAILVKLLFHRDRIFQNRFTYCELITNYLKSINEKYNFGKIGEMKFSLPPSVPTQLTLLSSMGLSTETSDFNQWLHAMKMVAVLPGGMPPEFRKKLWLALADKHLQNNNIDWSKEQIKCLSENWRTDDEELGVQIVKDLHRTGSSLCSGPMGTLNQAKLKRVLLGYARWNPEVGYCQGFNMLGALILQVMDKSEADTIKIMILLVEGVLPQGYFCGSLSGLQADMAVFRELLSTKLPKLSKHLQKLQGSFSEDNFEPPLTNVFTMQWFLTLFCTCLPISCVLRVWDLILIEGSDILLRTALTIWSLLEERILKIKTADDFYCKMGLLSSEILSGNLIDSNGLIQKIVDMGAIDDLKKLRDKHLYNISPWRDKKGLMLFYSDDDGDSDDDSRLAVTTAWGVRGSRRASLGGGPSTNIRTVIDNKDRLALDISLLKQQYTKLRERQRQAHIILTTACARQSSNSSGGGSSVQMNQFLLGRSAILSRKGRRIGPPPGAVPPSRKTSTVKPVKNIVKQTKRGETLHWKDTDVDKKRRNSLKWKDIKNDGSVGFDESETSSSKTTEEIRPSSTTSSLSNTSESQKTATPSHKRSESSSYSEESDSNSSTSTSLCDDENQKYNSQSSIEQSPIKKKINPEIEVPECNKNEEIQKYIDGIKNSFQSSTSDDLVVEDENLLINFEKTPEMYYDNPSVIIEEESENIKEDDSVIIDNDYEQEIQDNLLMNISSISQLSPIPDISQYISLSTISPLKTPSVSNVIDYSDYIPLLPTRSSLEDIPDASSVTDEIIYNVSDEGVTNEFFERINLDRPSRLDITDIYEPLKISTNFNDIFSKPSKTTNDNDEQGINVNTIIACSSSSTNLTVELPISTIKKNSDLPILPPCTDISSISIDKSPIITNKSMVSEELLAASTAVRPWDFELDYEFKINDRLNFLKEKSVSLDEPSTNNNEKEIVYQPSSCPEPRNEMIIGKNSDKVLKIIQENSIILHRILKKNSSTIDENDETTLYTKEQNDFTQILKDTESLLNESDKKIQKLEEKENYEEKTNLFVSDVCDIEVVVDDDSVIIENLDNDDDKSPPSDSINLSATLSSIENTIKSINMLCELNEDNMHDDKQNKINDFVVKSDEVDDIIIHEIVKLDSAVSVVVEPVLKTPLSPSLSQPPLINLIECPDDKSENVETSLNKIKIQTDDIDLGDSLSLSRVTRDIKREPSPRRRHFDYLEECESKAKRNPSPNLFNSSLPPNNINSNLNNLDSIENFINKLPSIDDNDTAAIKLSSIDCDEKYLKYHKPPEKPEIRHTTVTCTFYDRYLSQKKEEQNENRIDKSPSSPIITKSYLESLRPISADRIIRSAENSPSRYNKLDTNLIIKPVPITPSPTSLYTTHQSSSTSSSILSPSYYTSSYFSNYKNDDDNILYDFNSSSNTTIKRDLITHVKSCDNIMEKITAICDAKTEKRLSDVSMAIDHLVDDGVPDVKTAMHEEDNKTFSILPLKKREISEVGLKLGLYKRSSPVKSPNS